MELNPLLVREFVRVNNDKVSPPTSETINGTIVKTSGGILAVRIDGSDSYIECDSTVSYNEGDRVIIDITDHTPTVTGNLTDKAVGEETAKNVAQIAAGELVDSKIDQIVDEAAGSVIRRISGTYAEKTDTPKSVLMQYALSDSEIIPPSEGDWSTVAPTWEQGRYMWQRTVTIYGDDTESKPHRYIGEPTCISGAKGDPGEKGDKGDPGQDGQPGDPGVSVIAVTPIYFCTSGTEDEPTPPPKNTKVNIDDPKEYGKWNLQPAEWDGTHQVYFICSQIEYGDGSVDFSKVVKDSSLSKVTSEIIQQAGQISTKVDNTVYQTTITQLENSINQRVQKGDVVAEINASIDPDTGISKVQIEAGAINLNGVVTANDNFKILEDGSMETKAATIKGGSISLLGVKSSDSSTLPEKVNVTVMDGHIDPDTGVVVDTKYISQLQPGQLYMLSEAVYGTAEASFTPFGMHYEMPDEGDNMFTSFYEPSGIELRHEYYDDMHDSSFHFTHVNGNKDGEHYIAIGEYSIPLPLDSYLIDLYFQVDKNGIVGKTVKTVAGTDLDNHTHTKSEITDLPSTIGTYSKPSAGIPKTDLASAVQTSLGKADTALQTHQDISGKTDVGSTTKFKYFTSTAGVGGTKSVDISSIPTYTPIQVDIELTIYGTTKSVFSQTIFKPSGRHLYNVGGYYYSTNYYGSVFVDVDASKLKINTDWTKIYGGEAIAITDSNSKIYIYTTVTQ